MGMVAASCYVSYIQFLVRQRSSKHHLQSAYCLYQQFLEPHQCNTTVITNVLILVFQVMQIMEKLPVKRQTMMFSATIPPSIEKLAASLLQNPVYISVGLPSTPNSAVKQLILWVEDKSKKKCLFSLLQDPKHYRPPVVVFVDSKIGADLLAEAIEKV